MKNYKGFIGVLLVAFGVVAGLSGIDLGHKKGLMGNAIDQEVQRSQDNAQKMQTALDSVLKSRKSNRTKWAVSYVLATRNL